MLVEIGHLLKEKGKGKLEDLPCYKLFHNPEILECFTQEATKINLKNTNHPNKFYSSEFFVKKAIPAELREEAYYAAKTEEIYEKIPSMLVFFIKKAIKEFGSPNYAFYLMRSGEISDLIDPNKIPESVSVQEMIREISGVKDYVTFSKGVYKSPSGEDVIDIYIEETDSVARLKKSIADKLNLSDIKNVTLVKKTLMIGEKPLATLSGGVGLTKGTYELVDII